MVALPPRKRLVLVAFIFLLCYISITAKARSLPKGTNNNGAEKISKTQKADTFAPTEKGELSGSNIEDLVTIDYTPAKKKPPIHN